MPLVDRVGLGGGGSLYDPQVSSWNSALVFVACDMTGLYRSIDGGGHWTMLDTRIVQGSNRLSVAIHPIQQRLLGYHPFQGVKESTDGLIWNDFSPSMPLNAQAYPPLVQPSPGCPPPGTPNQDNNRGLVVTALSYCPNVNGRILAGTECGIFLYNEQTHHWQWVYPLDAMGNRARYPTYMLDVNGTATSANAAEVISFIALPNPHAAGQWVYFCVTSCFVLRSDNSGLTWMDISNNLPIRPLGVFYPGLPSDTLTTTRQTVDPNYKPSRIRGFAGGYGSAASVGGTGDHFILYATVATSLTGSTVDGGVYYYDSLDDPASQPNLTPNWRGVMGNGINFSPVGTTPIGPPTFSDDRNGRVIPRYERLAVSRNDPHTLYVSALNTLYHYPTIYRGTYTRPGNQGSVTWIGAYEGFQTNTTPLQPNPGGPIVPGTMVTNLQGGWIEDDLGWGFGGSANSLTAAPNSSDRVFLANTAAVHMTDNGTANPPNWVSRYTDQVPDNTGTGAPWWRTTGLDITSAWNYYVRPANRHYIANTDIGLSQSIDGGDTWRSFHPGCTAPMPPPLSQCSLDWSEFYELAFEGTNIWAAVSMQHDLPYDLDHLKPGAVLFSTNNGDSWQELTGLPQIPVGMPPVMITPPVTSVVRVPGTIYVALWRGGVFARNDGATSWNEVKVAAPAAGHRAALTGLATYRLQLSGSTLYCVVSDGSADAGLYSCNPNPGSNQGWQPIGMVGQYRVIDFALNTDGTTVNQYLCIDNLGVHNAPAVYKLVTPQMGVSTWTDLTVPFSTANTLHGDRVVVFALSFIGDMVYASSITHGIWCAQLKEVNAYTGSGSISWVQYRALPFTNAQRITELGDPASGSSTLIITSFGGGVARVQRNFYFVVDRGEFTQGEVAAVAMAAGGNLAPYPSALYAVLDGFLPIELMGARTATDLLANFQVQVVTPGAKGVTVMLNSSGPQIDLEDSLLPAERFQRVAFQLTISIDKTQAFAQGAPRAIDIKATFGRYSCTATIRLTDQPIPFMQDGDTPWLSLDVAAFQVSQGDTVFGLTLTAQTSPTAFIQNILDKVRQNPLVWQSEFNNLRDGPKSVLQLSQYVPRTNPAVPTYNFALARVHNADPAIKATAFNVFFRLFNTAWTGFEYDPNQAYRTATSGPAPIAVLGVKTGLGEGGAVVSVPCFASDRVQPSAMLSTQQDPYNQVPSAHGIEINPDSFQVYGCWLDFNQPTQLFPQYPGTQDGQFTGTLFSIQELIRGRHQCLVVEIYRPGDSITTGATPGTSDRLSQRNLFIVGCDNPGPPAAHVVQHSFEIMAPLHRERSRLARGEAEGERRFMDTDELVFMGADLPDGTRAQLFFPTVNVEDLLAAQGGQLRAKAYRRVDDHTIEFDPSEMSYLSLPPGHVGNLPGLLSIQLPEGVRRDQEFRYRVQQWSDHRVLGQFELRIPVAVPQDLLLEEENKLAVLRYIQLATPIGDAWRDVLDRYVEQVADRVRGLGGDPDSIDPSGAGVGAPGQGLKGCLATLIRIVSEHPVAFLIGGVALVLLLAWLRDLRRRIAKG